MLRCPNPPERISASMMRAISSVHVTPHPSPVGAHGGSPSPPGGSRPVDSTYRTGQGERISAVTSGSVRPLARRCALPAMRSTGPVVLSRLMGSTVDPLPQIAGLTSLAWVSVRMDSR